MSGGGNEVASGQAWNKQQKYVGRELGQMITNYLREPLPYQPTISDLDRVYDPALTQDYFQKAIFEPMMYGLTGPYGSLSRVGAGQAARGTYFSSGRQQEEANAVLGAGQQLATGYAGLMGEDITAAQSEWARRQPLTGQMTQQALNFLGTPMMTASQQQPSPWGAMGMQLGISTAPVWGPAAVSAGGSAIQGIGSAVASLLALLSDIRLKKNISYIESNKFPRMAVWEWNEIANTLGLHGFGRGYIAQDLEQIAPNSVITTSSGYKAILYRGSL